MKGLFKVLLGLGIGAVIGVVFAPKSGKELRKQLVGTATRRTLPPPPPLHETARDWMPPVPEPEPDFEPGSDEEVVASEAATVADPEPAWEPETASVPEPVVELAEAEPVIEETVVREDRVITDEGVIEDIVTLEERVVTPEGDVLEETVWQEEPAVIEEPAVAEEPVVFEQLAAPVVAEEPGVADDLRARIEATRAEIETSLAEPYSGATLAEDIGEAGPADDALIAEAIGGESCLVEETVVRETVLDDAGGLPVVEEAIIEETVVAGMSVDEVVVEDMVVRGTMLEEEGVPSPAVAEAQEPVLVWPEADNEAVPAREAPASFDPAAEAEILDEQPEAPRAWDMWRDEEEDAQPVTEDAPVAAGAPATPVFAETIAEPAVVATPAAEPGAAAESAPAAAASERTPLAAAPEPGPEPDAAEPAPADLRDTGAIDQAEMRRRIEETRARLKAKAFDAMMSGEAALLGRDDDASSAPRHDDPKLDGDVESTIDDADSAGEYSLAWMSIDAEDGEDVSAMAGPEASTEAAEAEPEGQRGQRATPRAQEARKDAHDAGASHAPEDELVVDSPQRLSKARRSSPPADVEFTLAWPAAVTTGASFVLDVWAHLPEERAEVLERVREEYASIDTSAKTKKRVQLARGSELVVRLEIAGLVVDDPETSLVWDGHLTSADFLVTVPRELGPGLRAGSVTFSVKGLRVSRMAFQLLIVNDPVQSGSGGNTTSSHHERAFASYASEDRDRVLARVQGMETVVPMQVFVDVETLRSSAGSWEDQLRERIDDANVMYLFWSKAAEASKWVDWEWRYALDRHGLGFIDPVPLEPPALAPPPPELQKLHFDSKWLAFMRDPALS